MEMRDKGGPITDSFGTPEMIFLHSDVLTL